MNESVNSISIIQRWTVSTFHYESQQIISKEYQKFYSIWIKEYEVQIGEKGPYQTDEGILWV